MSNKLGDIGGQAKVEIEPREKRPAFVSDLQDAQVVDGFPVKFEVKVIGHPQPKLQWSHNGIDIVPDNARIKVSQNPAGNASLFIGKIEQNLPLGIVKIVDNVTRLSLQFVISFCSYG